MNKKFRVVVIDNGGQWTHRIWRVTRDLGYSVEIISNKTPVKKIDAQALILSGGAPRVSFEGQKLGRNKEYLEKFPGKILGICVGHQLMALIFGGKVGEAEISEYGLAEIKILKPDDLFKGLPKKLLAWESHNDEVKSAPAFFILASSKNTKIQAIKHKKKPFWGVQFHPEVAHTQYGQKIIKNFLETKY